MFPSAKPPPLYWVSVLLMSDGGPLSRKHRTNSKLARFSTRVLKMTFYLQSSVKLVSQVYWTPAKESVIFFVPTLEWKEKSSTSNLSLLVHVFNVRHFLAVILILVEFCYLRYFDCFTAGWHLESAFPVSSIAQGQWERGAKTPEVMFHNLLRLTQLTLLNH